MSWKAEVAATLGARVVSAEPVAGGDINDAYRARLDDGRVVFVKTHRRAAPDLFAAEARGLEWLRAGPLRIPAVVGYGPQFLALEWLELGRAEGRRGQVDATARGGSFDAALGRGLAQLHRLGAPGFGLDHDNYLATLRQPAVRAPDAITLYVEHRLRPVCAQATAAGRMAPVDAQLDQLRARPDRFGPPEPPARLHGDLWWGNVVATQGAPALVDPAVYGGPREIDLAMLALFGGLPDALVGAYEEVTPLATGWRQRISLWQLYPLAVHAALFGAGYGAQVTRNLAELL